MLLFSSLFLIILHFTQKIALNKEVLKGKEGCEISLHGMSEESSMSGVADD